MSDTILYLRVNEINTTVKPHTFASLHIAVHSSATDSPIISRVIEENVLLCNNIWKFKVVAQEMQKMIIVLKQSRFLRSKIDLAKVVIPLSWFPVNRVVRHWFPMRTHDGSTTMILLDVHIDNQKARPFLPELGELKVRPLWSTPGGSAPPLTGSEYRLPGTAPLVAPESMGQQMCPPQFFNEQPGSNEIIYYEQPILPVAPPSQLLFQRPPLGPTAMQPGSAGDSAPVIPLPPMTAASQILSPPQTVQ